MAYGEMLSYTDDFKEQTNYYYDYIYEPREGSMLIFPAHLVHRVEENKSEKDRISISFNIDLLNFLEWKSLRYYIPLYGLFGRYYKFFEGMVQRS